MIPKEEPTKTFTKKFQDRMMFLKNFRKKHAVRNWREHPSTFTEEELNEQITAHKTALEQMSKSPEFTNNQKEKDDDF